MLAKETYDFRGYLQEKGIIFCYSGYITEDVLTGIGNAVKTKLEHEKAGGQKRTHFLHSKNNQICVRSRHRTG
ncbi:MAG: hypothetical protein HOB79_12410 [Rhodospirillaceae bacterium]|jgi:hypothetical protein|nr:hypothetical protein [Rhodospirillales bacterium]MBT3905302.1 hypothetical protein [Rhodospirillaceae bacterium]MBT4701864.1 hypothetical protein [Rhodospirillaceae bacterium]MBT5036583.1 hypothetical protein [Rhodospirillaceae bacterium]MBT6219345.1 hypothetical protein [Rhodospirillaceae bacterium]